MVSGCFELGGYGYSDFKIESKPKRDDWNVYFMKMADFASSRATCDRKHCGAVIVKDNEIISTGYNGADPGQAHCDDVGHFMVDNHCVRTIHAENNAIKQAKKRLASLVGCKIYINTYPCWDCFGKILESGIEEIFYKDGYRNNPMVESVAGLFEVTITKVNTEPKDNV